MNKKLVLCIGLGCLFFPISAQILTMDKYMPHRTDSLIAFKQPFVHVPDTGMNCIWNFSNFQADTLLVCMDYYTISTDTTHIGLHKARTNYKMHLIMDSVYITGFETTNTKVHYTRPEFDIMFPIGYGDSLCNPFSGLGTYCHVVPFSINGYSVIKCDALGKMILPEDTIDTVLCIHKIRRYCEIAYDTTHVCENSYRWYALGVRYPLVETIKMTSILRNDTSKVEMTYYIPQELEKPNTSYKIQQKETLFHADLYVTDVALLPNPVHSDLQISYHLTRDADVSVSIHYNGGITMFSMPALHQNAGQNKIVIDMQHYPVGTYVLYLHVDDVVMGRTIIKL